MRTFILHLSGATIEDAFIYRSSLYCWTFHRTLRVYAVADLEFAAGAQAGNSSDLLAYCLFHSRGLGANTRQSRASSAAWETGTADLYVQLDAENVPYYEIDINMEADSVLDMLIYYDRMYLATDGGLFALDGFDEQEDSGERLTARPRIKQACYAASAGLGTVAASCGTQGLSLLLDVPGGVLADDAPARKVSDTSLRAEIGFGTVVNHQTRTDFEFLIGDVDRAGGSSYLRDVHRGRTERSDVVRSAMQELESDGQFALWDQSRMLLFSSANAISVSVMRNNDERRLNKVREVSRYQNAVSRVVSAARVGRFFAVEDEDSVALVSPGNVRTISTGPAVSVRTYPSSRRYQRLTTATSASGLWLFGAEEYPAD